MASEPIPEPLTNQEVTAEREADFARSGRRGPEPVDRTSAASPPIPPERELPRAPRVHEIKQAAQETLADVKESASRVADEAKGSVSRVVEQTKEQAAEAKERVASAYAETREKASDALDRARSRAQYLMDEYPLQVIAGIAATGFLIGVLLRVWRSSRDE